MDSQGWAELRAIDRKDNLRLAHAWVEKVRELVPDVKADKALNVFLTCIETGAHMTRVSVEIGGRIERIDIDTGAVEVLYKSGDFGCVLRGPNDIVFDSHGGFWFTDHGKVDYAKRCHDIVGIFYGKTDGSFLEEVIFPSNNPNGIGLSPDGKRLYAAETYTCRLMAFNVIAPGKVDDAAGPGGPGIPIYRPAGYKFFDSLAMEANGNICVATIGECGISVISPEGELVEFVATPDIFTTNICFGGHDMMDAWLCLSGTGKLAKVRWNRPGLKLEY
jgi:gluconolactonase